MKKTLHAELHGSSWRKKSFGFMKFLLILLMVFKLGAVNANEAETQKITLKLASVTVEKVFREVEKKSDFRFVYQSEDVKKLDKVNVDVKDADIHAILDICLKGVKLDYLIDKNYVIIRPSKEKVSDEDPDIEIKGEVKDQDGAPLPGATILEMGTSNGVTSNVDGSFLLKVKNPNAALKFSFIGFETQVITLDGQTQLSVSLDGSLSTLDEVVVVGYGTTAVKDLTGAVARVSEEQLEVKNVASTASLLQNMAAGVLVTGSTGRPGENVRVRVRGESSLSGSNEPLYVLDGVPSSSSILNTLPPSDITSIDVLKDASASAIYGSRAANGVVMITTKHGRLNEKAQFSVNYNSSYDTQIKNFRMLDGDEFRAFITDLATKTLVVDPGNWYAPDILDPDGGYLEDANTDWFKEVKQVAKRQNIDMSIRGGSDKITYFLSGSVMDQQGMVVNDNLTRYSGRINIDAQVNTQLKIGTKISLSYTDKSKSGTSMFTAQGYRPDLPIYLEDGVTFYDKNPVAKSKIIDDYDEYSIAASLYGELTILKDIKFKSSMSINQYMGYNYSFEPSFLDYWGDAVASRSESRGFGSVFDNTISYQKVLNEVHSFDFVGGVSFEEFDGQDSYLSKWGYPMDEIYINVSAGTEYYYDRDSKYGSALFSSFGRLNYKYKDKYLATFTARRDASSMFGKNNSWGFFPSGALAWRINKEDFLSDVKFINDLKLKVSAGKTGIQNLGSYSNRDLYGATSYYGLPAIVHSQIGNPDIQWEHSTMYDIGMDFTLFDYKISGSVAYYIKNTSNLIRSFTFPSSMAVSSMYYNIGSVKNQGFELYLNANIINKKDLNFDLGINIATNRNIVKKLEEQGSIENSSGAIVQGQYSQVLAEGYAMGSFFGYEYEGIIQSQEQVEILNAAAIAEGHSYYDGNKLFPGNLLFKDLNGDGKISPEDRTIIGNPNPDLYGGINATLKYKRFTIRANFGFQVGGLKQYGKALQNVPGQLTGLVDYNLYNRWSPDNTDAEIPAIYLGQGVARLTKLQLFDASYFRLQDIRISYDFPKLKNIPVNGQVYVSVTNLFTLTSYPGTDPATVNAYGNYGGHSETSYPGISTISFGLKFNL